MMPEVSLSILKTFPRVIETIKDIWFGLRYYPIVKQITLLSLKVIQNSYGFFKTEVFIELTMYKVVKLQIVWTQ